MTKLPYCNIILSHKYYIIALKKCNYKLKIAQYFSYIKQI